MNKGLMLKTGQTHIHRYLLPLHSIEMELGSEPDFGRIGAEAVLQMAKYWTLQIEKLGDIFPTSRRSREYCVILSSPVLKRSAYAVILSEADLDAA